MGAARHERALVAQFVPEAPAERGHVGIIRRHARDADEVGRKLGEHPGQIFVPPHDVEDPGLVAGPAGHAGEIPEAQRRHDVVHVRALGVLEIRRLEEQDSHDRKPADRKFNPRFIRCTPLIATFAMTS